MSSNARLVEATPQEVWAALADGWLYPAWVVGATRMRHVDDHWPEVGAQLHHSVGVWPCILDDTTEVTESLREQRLGLRARAWPSGEAGVTISLEPVGARTRVVLEEDAAAGPGRLVPAPLRHLPLTWRNTETLRRLAYIAERRR